MCAFVCLCLCVCYGILGEFLTKVCVGCFIGRTLEQFVSLLSGYPTQTLNFKCLYIFGLGFRVLGFRLQKGVGS